MKCKTAFMVLLYFIPLGVVLSGLVTSFSGLIFNYVLMALGMSGIGLSIMHDANHGAYSNSKKINGALGYLINFIGGYHETWKIQHNVLHHSFTNIHGHDEDIDQNVMRLSPDQERKAIFKYQAYYATFFYGLLSLYRCFIKDTEQLFRYNRENLLSKKDHSFGYYLTELIITKALYIFAVLILPIIVLDLPIYQIFISFFVMHYIAGLILALIFQPAHVLEETDFFVPNENNTVENNWIIHEMKTTANFANGNRIFSWLIGGLNFQVEHHLFPHICHVHYRSIAGIVQSTAAEYDVPYNHHPTYYGALKSHYSMLNKLGTGEYDRKRR